MAGWMGHCYLSEYAVTKISGFSHLASPQLKIAIPKRKWGPKQSCLFGVKGAPKYYADSHGCILDRIDLTKKCIWTWGPQSQIRQRESIWKYYGPKAGSIEENAANKLGDFLLVLAFVIVFGSFYGFILVSNGESRLGDICQYFCHLWPSTDPRTLYLLPKQFQTIKKCLKAYSKVLFLHISTFWT